MKLRLKAYSVSNDIYYIQKRFLFMWWTCDSYGAGSKEKMTKIMNEV
jgi:hypothetical protein